MGGVADHILSFYASLPASLSLPKGIDLIYPFGDKDVGRVLKIFYKKYYSDRGNRLFLLGINPGRFGAGMTGVPFTDPILLAEHCGIENDFEQKHELSSVFIHKMIAAMGGPDIFYKQFYISSVCPLGFTKEGKNYNYYDSEALYNAIEPFIVESITSQVNRFCDRRVAFSIGQGKNYKIFKSLNEEHQWFDIVLPLPHPRWVMQYKRKSLDIHLSTYITSLSDYL